MSSPKQALINSVDDNDTLPAHEALYEWIADHPDYADLLEQAKHNTLPTISPAQAHIAWVKNLFLANPNEFYGRAYSTKELVTHSNRTAAVVSISGLYDFFTNLSLFYLAFRSMGLLSIPLSFAVNLLMLKFGNDCAAVASGYKPSLKAWAKAGVVGLLAVNMIQSIFSGIGIELLLNGPAISELKATSLIAEQELKIEALQTLSPRQQQADTNCRKGDAELRQMPASDPNRHSLYVRLYGTWGQTQKDWSQVPESQLPTCELAKRLEATALKNYEMVRANWEILKVQRLQMGNDVIFLQRAVPELYTFHFEETGEMKSSIEATGFAALNLRQKAMKGDWAGLTMPIFFVSLSIFTSLIACWMTITHAHRPDALRSRNSAVEQERDRWLEQQYQALSHTRHFKPKL
ncbi:hypothetical protein GS597_16455 [Synechococcales cyanobacterium C]|uniref:Uncharacterized protein n=1 Tax=Petrachloros mirabilis ULC683 TaxID=2781853 RepID=A0A8K1ZZ97_9CYAN|nr:hypothetical protein [Petrachloros mirabilis]NCJ08070.1 hypothetical protein [Petrachloros mirabilis ULC683]